MFTAAGSRDHLWQALGIATVLKDFRRCPWQSLFLSFLILFELFAVAWSFRWFFEAFAVLKLSHVFKRSPLCFDAFVFLATSRNGVVSMIWTTNRKKTLPPHHLIPATLHVAATFRLQRPRGPRDFQQACLGIARLRPLGQMLCLCVADRCWRLAF